MQAANTVGIAPGSVVEVRDEEWLVTHVSRNADGALITVRGLSELVADTTAQFSEALDEITVQDPSETKVVADASPNYRRARLWLEATLRKTPLALDDPSLAVVDGVLADSLDYQRTAVRRALAPENLRPRLLLADTVGLGKTLEIGMILSELVRRGRGERILIVTPRHVLEQMQHEMWSRFALPFVRLDSVGIQQVRQKLPASRNPFSYYKRAIISIDTLKSDRYLNHLKRQRWDAVVIDESHNVTNVATQNNRLAATLAPTTDALILASATPHNGRAESFAEMIRLLEPTAVSPEGELHEEELQRLVVRRHRHSPEVAQIVGAEWAERQQPNNRLVAASAAENAIADELAHAWLYTADSGRDTLFGWTLAKAFLSSPAALEETVERRLQKPRDAAERASLAALAELAATAARESGGKYAALLEELARIGISRTSEARVVIFAERVATLHWLRDRLAKDLKLAKDQIAVLHGQLSDVEQLEVVDQFKQGGSPLRVLVTGDVASEGVNLHQQCHELIHYDIPWSLIRIEQRNGRIDRYGQRHSPRLTTLLLQPDHEHFRGDIRVLTSLMEKEHEAHSALGDTASLMGKHSVKGEEQEILSVLLHQKDLDDVVQTPDDVMAAGGLDAMLAALAGFAATTDAEDVQNTTPPTLQTGLYESPVDFLREAVTAIYLKPAEEPRRGGGGVAWQEFPDQQVVELTPPDDLKARLNVLPQTYLREREVMKRLRLVTSRETGKKLLARALADEGTSWPAAHFLGPLHPVLDWASDRCLAALGRGQVFAVRGDVDAPTVLLMGTLMNAAGQTVSSSLVSATFPAGPDGFSFVTPHASAAAMIEAVGLGPRLSNPGPVAGVEELTSLIPPAVRQVGDQLAGTEESARAAAEQMVDQWQKRLREWKFDAEALVQRSDVQRRRVSVQQEEALLERRRPAQSLVRPLLVVVPKDHPVAEESPASSAGGQ